MSENKQSMREMFDNFKQKIKPLCNQCILFTKQVSFKMKVIFTEHPRAIGESYIQHFKSASWFGLKLMLGGLACIIHSVFPFLFIETASRTVHEVYEKMHRRKDENKK